MGAHITLDFERNVRIAQMSYTQRASHSRSKDVRLDFSDGTSQLVTLVNTGDTMTVELERTSNVRSVTITVETIYSSINNGFAEVAFFGTES